MTMDSVDIILYGYFKCLPAIKTGHSSIGVLVNACIGFQIPYKFWYSIWNLHIEELCSLGSSFNLALPSSRNAIAVHS